jgi:hypothetical protein
LPLKPTWESLPVHPRQGSALAACMARNRVLMRLSSENGRTEGISSLFMVSLTFWPPCLPALRVGLAFCPTTSCMRSSTTIEDIVDGVSPLVTGLQRTSMAYLHRGWVPRRGKPGTQMVRKNWSGASRSLLLRRLIGSTGGKLWLPAWPCSATQKCCVRFTLDQVPLRNYRRLHLYKTIVWQGEQKRKLCSSLATIAMLGYPSQSMNIETHCSKPNGALLFAAD